MPSKPEKMPSAKQSEDVRRRYLIQVYLRAQSWHLLGSSFALNEIFVEPGFIPPPLQISPDLIPTPNSVVNQILPYLPDWPEFMAAYSVKPIPIVDCLKSGRDIAILGHAGCGKTAALAYLASLIASEHPSVSFLENPLPILVHARDLVEFSTENQPLKLLVEISSKYSPDLAASRIEDIITGEVISNHAILFLDGLDELPRTLIAECHEVVKSLKSLSKGLRVIATGPLDYMDGFIASGFSPLVMSLWNRPTLINFIHKFIQSYLKRFDSKLTDEEKDLIFSSILSWVTRYPYTRTPIEYTLQCVSAILGSETGDTSFNILNTFINQMVPSSSTRASLEVLAYQTLISENPVINKYEIDHYVPELVQTEPDTGPQQTDQNIRTNKALALVSKKIILQHTLKGNVFFTHPIFLGFLASNALIRNGQCQVIFSQPDWTAKELALKYLSHLIDTTQYIEFNKLDDDAPLFGKLFSVAHWLRECKQGVIFRPQIMRRLAQLINSENQPLSIRAKAIAGIIFSNEKNIAGLFRQYLASNSTSIKILTAYACGIIQDATLFKDLSVLLSDPDPVVRVAASMAIAKWDLPQAQDLTARILLQADENMRRAVAETLSLNPVEGAQTLMDGTSHKDILVRRASVYGLAMIDQPWSRQQLQKLQIEDGQWVIRNTAAQVLENLNTFHSHIPRAIPEPYLAPWLVSFASRHGAGISPTASAIPLLLQVLNSGTDEEKMAAMEYLSIYQEEGVIARLYDITYGSQPLLREYGIYTLWKISLSGNQFPSTKKYGFN
jgi:hypothetical protein